MRIGVDKLSLGKQAWKEIECIAALGYSTSSVFSDWLDVMLDSFLALSDNIDRYGDVRERLMRNELDGKYNDRYMGIVEKYRSDKRPAQEIMEHFAAATGHLVCETQETREDVLGHLYMEYVSFGEHGQFFTPAHLARAVSVMAGIEDGKTVLDPTCGSGRMLIEAGRANPKVFLQGIDIDERCAKMCALNMYIFGFDAAIRWGNGLTYEYWRQWRILPGGFIFESGPVPGVENLGQLPASEDTPKGEAQATLF